MNNIQNIGIKKIIQSINDPRIYKPILLSNKLLCLLISDKNTDKSAASMSINIGSINDPKEYQGMAHFLEHMLFLGTQKYPVEGSYKEYLTKNSGSSNAYTSIDETNFYFQCSNNALYGALDRFSDFFKQPLFTDSCTQRELNAVHSEHQKNLQQDGWRDSQLFKSSAKKTHLYNRFSTGNLETLQKEDIRDRLIEFYQKNYSANLMKLVIYSQEEIEKIESYAHEFFSDIKNYDYDQLQITDQPFDSTNLKQLWKISPVNDVKKIKFVWIIPESVKKYYENNPASYISHLIGHEGENSILSLLIKQGLAYELSSGCSHELDLFSKLSVSISLSQKGLDQYKTVCNIVFQYLKMLRQNGCHQWIHDEVKLVNQMKFDYKDIEKAGGYVVNVSSNLSSYPLEDVLVHGYLNRNYDEKLIKDTINKLNIDNLRIYLIAKEFDPECDQTEPIYKTKFSTSEIPQDLQQNFFDPQVTFPSEILNLPPQNIFLPKNMKIINPPAQQFQYPQMIHQDQFTEVYYKQDTTFLKPKAVISLFIHMPQILQVRPELYLSGLIYKKMMSNFLREFLYLADQANLKTTETIQRSGFQIQVFGFDSSMQSYFKQLTIKLKSFFPDDIEQFNIQKEQIYRNYTNHYKLPPYNQIDNSQFLKTNTFTIEECHKAIEKVNIEMVQEFAKALFNQNRYTWFVMGNISQENSILIAKETEQILNSQQILPLEDIVSYRSVLLNSQTTYFYERVLTEPNEKNSAVSVYFQYGEQTITNKLLIDFVVNTLKASFFEILRTQEQLGYIVQSYQYSIRGTIGVEFLIQSSVKCPQYLISRIDAYLNQQAINKVSNLTEEEFEQYRESIRIRISEKDTSMYQEFDRYEREISSNLLVFDRQPKQLLQLQKITLQQFKEFFQDFIFKEKKRFESHFISQVHVEENNQLKQQRSTFFQENNQKLLQVDNNKQFWLQHKLFPDFYAKI